MPLALLQRLVTGIGNLVSVRSQLSTFLKILVALTYSIILSKLLAVMSFADSYFVSVGLFMIIINLLELLYW